MAIPTLRTIVQMVRKIKKEIPDPPFRITTCDENPNFLVKEAFTNIGNAWKMIRKASPYSKTSPEYQQVITLAQQAIESLCLKVQALYEVFHAGEPTRNEAGQLTEGNLRAHRADAAYPYCRYKSNRSLESL